MQTYVYSLLFCIGNNIVDGENSVNQNCNRQAGVIGLRLVFGLALALVGALLYFGWCQRSVVVERISRGIVDEALGVLAVYPTVSATVNLAEAVTIIDFSYEPKSIVGFVVNQGEHEGRDRDGYSEVHKTLWIGQQKRRGPQTRAVRNFSEIGAFAIRLKNPTTESTKNVPRCSTVISDVDGYGQADRSVCRSHYLNVLMRDSNVGTFNFLIRAERCPQDFGLRFAGLMLSPANENETTSQKHQDECETTLRQRSESRNNIGPLIVLRAAIFAGSLLIVAVSLILGTWNLYRNGNIVPTLLIWSVGAVAFGCGLCWCLLTLIPATWGWWL
jgi:hypothetical protein